MERRYLCRHKQTDHHFILGETEAFDLDKRIWILIPVVQTGNGNGRVRIATGSGLMARVLTYNSSGKGTITRLTCKNYWQVLSNLWIDNNALINNEGN